jgi:hypothetical protein
MFLNLIKIIFNKFSKNNNKEMNDKNINNNSIENSVQELIPRFVGHYRRLPDEKISQIIEINSETNQSLVDKKFCDFFKCTKNLINSENRDQNNGKCFATRNTQLLFTKHLNEKHPNEELFCIYCYPEVNDRTTVKKNYNHRYLVKHMFKRHRFRRYQCNQCLYRALTEDHLNIHQSLTHESNSDQNVCKIFKCLPINGENSVPNLYYYYNRYKTERFNTDGKNETLFQCLYCDFMNEDLKQVINHCVDKHLDYPIMYFIPEPKISSSTSCLISESVYETVSREVTNNKMIASHNLKTEPQDNSISSTCALKIDKTVDDSTKRLSVDSNQQNNSLVKPKTSSDDCNDSSKRPKIIETVSETDFSNALNSYDEKVVKSQQKVRNSSTDSSNSLNSNNTIDSNIKCSNNSITDKRKSYIIEEKCDESLEQKFICLFCDQLFTDQEIAKNHLESHFPVIVEVKNIQQWIKQFLLKQSQLSSYENSLNVKENYAFYRCPLCVKMSAINKRKAKQYTSFNEVKTHLLQHSCWLSIKCKFCSINLLNCDSLIANHMKDSHKELLSSPKNENLKFLFGNESEIESCFKQFKEDLIEVNSDQVIDPFLDLLLKRIKEEYEQQLRVINNCHKFVVKPVVYKLPEIDFDDRNAVKKLCKRWKKKENKGMLRKRMRESFEEIDRLKKRIRSLNDNNEKCVDSRINDRIENHSDNDIESNSFDKIKVSVIEGMNMFEKQIEKINEEVDSNDRNDKNSDENSKLSANKDNRNEVNDMIDCVP